MSKLADRLRKAGRTEHAPMGFAMAARTSTPTLLCLVRLSSNESNKAGEAAEKGADAVIIEGADSGKVKEATKKAAQLSVGVRAQKAERKEVSSLREAGADFVVLDIESGPAEALLEEKIGLVLTGGRELDDTTMRLLADLGLDALIAPTPNGPLTLERLLALRRIAALARTPLLIEVAADSDVSYLQALRDSGVAGVIVDSSSIARLGRLRETIAALPLRGRKREERGEAMLPAPALAGVSSDDYDDDNDE